MESSVRETSTARQRLIVRPNVKLFGRIFFNKNSGNGLYKKQRRKVLAAAVIIERM
ncbi:hypothetical protein [Paenibacillus odorifer]|uniref:hypothetical protein n=1 Tax=Paenibacillus odorifer TaxID=189426 RepID=UPI0015C39C1F|nr:hypothetical protein [Paenibacillus odorifer]